MSTSASDSPGRATVEERDFLLRSLEDLELEREAGDIADSDYFALRDLYVARAASVMRALGELGDLSEEPSRTRRREPSCASEGEPGRQRSPRVRHRWMAVCGSGLVLGGVVLWAVLAGTGARQPGGVPSGGRSESIAAILNAAEAADAAGDDVDALVLYRQVLARDSVQPEALAEAGWIEFEIGTRHSQASLVASGQKLEEHAVEVAPNSWAPRLYLGSMEHAEGDDTDAVVQFRALLALNPPPAKLQAVVPVIVAAFDNAHQPLPALPGAVTPKGR